MANLKWIPNTLWSFLIPSPLHINMVTRELLPVGVTLSLSARLLAALIASAQRFFSYKFWLLQQNKSWSQLFCFERNRCFFHTLFYQYSQKYIYLFSLTGLRIAIPYHTVVKTNSLPEKEVSKKCTNACSNVPSVKGHSLEWTIGLIILTGIFYFLTLFYLLYFYLTKICFSQCNEKCLWVKLRNKKLTVLLYTVGSKNYESLFCIHLHHLCKATVSEVTMK